MAAGGGPPALSVLCFGASLTEGCDIHPLVLLNSGRTLTSFTRRRVFFFLSRLTHAGRSFTPYGDMLQRLLRERGWDGAKRVDVTVRGYSGFTAQPGEQGLPPLLDAAIAERKKAGVRMYDMVSVVQTTTPA